MTDGKERRKEERCRRQGVYVNKREASFNSRGEAWDVIIAKPIKEAFSALITRGKPEWALDS